MSLHLLQFKNKTIHAITEENGDLWFKASDICDALGYTNPHDAVKNHVHDDDLEKREGVDSLGRKNKINFINESGMYALIFGSNLPKAKEFKRWVTSEILPALRKNGAYNTNKNPSFFKTGKVACDYVTMSQIVYFVRFVERHEDTFKKINEMLKVFNCFLIESLLYHIKVYLKPIEKEYCLNEPDNFRWY